MGDTPISSRILQAYFHGQQLARQREKMVQDFKLKTEAAEQRKEEFRQEMEQRKKQFDLEHSLRKTAADLTHQMNLGAIQGQAAETGLTPPGAAETLSPTSTTQQDFELLNQNTLGMGPNQVRPGTQGPELRREIQLPTGDKFAVPDFMSYRMKQAEGQRITQAPKIEGAISQAVGIAREVSKIKQPYLLELATAKSDQAKSLEDQRAQHAKELQEQKDKATALRQGSSDDKRLEGQRLRAHATLAKTNASQQEKNDALAAIADDFKDGSATFEELPKGPDGLKLRGALAKEGYRPILKKDKENLEGLSMVSLLYNKYKALNDAYKEAGITGIISPKVKFLEQEADAVLGNASRLYGGERGVLTQEDIKRIKGSRPGQAANLLDAAANERRLSDFLQFYRDKSDVIKGTVSPQQSKALDERFKLIIPLEKVGRNRDGSQSPIVSYDNGRTWVEKR